MSYEISIKLDKRHQKVGSVLADKVKRNMPKVLDRTFGIIGGKLAGQIIENLSGESHVQYPGNSNPFPGVISGTLKRSVTWKLLKPYGVVIGPGGAANKYAAVQEFGNTSKNIPARPYVKPAWKKKKRDVFKEVDKIYRRAMKGK